MTSPAGHAPGQDSVPVFYVNLALDEEAVERCRRLLSYEERLRADRMQNTSARRNLTVMRAELRRLLSLHTGHPAHQICFTHGPFGKPEIVDRQNRAGLKFNVSHSADRGIIALSWGHAVGVDIESWRGVDDLSAVAESSLSPAELTVWRSAGQDRQQETFFRLWTRKEALLKALGVGLTQPMSSFETIRPGREPLGELAAGAITEIAPQGGDGRRFNVVSLPAPTAYSASLAIEVGEVAPALIDRVPVGLSMYTAS